MWPDQLSLVFNHVQKNIMLFLSAGVFLTFMVPWCSTGFSCNLTSCSLLPKWRNKVSGKQLLPTQSNKILGYLEKQNENAKIAFCIINNLIRSIDFGDDSKIVALDILSWKGKETECR